MARRGRLRGESWLIWFQSAMNYLLPLEWTTTFIPLQDKCPVSSFESIERMFREDTGGELQDYFSEFSRSPSAPRHWPKSTSPRSGRPGREWP